MNPSSLLLSARALALVAGLALAGAACSDNSRIIAPEDGSVPTGDMGGTGQCSLPNIRCGVVCADPRTDTANCGGCGINCGTGRVCVNGVCDNECPSGQLRCGDRCVNPQTNRLHCGECDRACPAGLVCAAGRCDLECGSRYTSCDFSVPDSGRPTADTGPVGGRVCADIRSDELHCGSCDIQCPLGHACVSGACELRCLAGATTCDGRCVDTMTDTRNCGACGTVCPGLQRCVSGMCTGTACPTGTMACGADCVDVTSNAAHCGMCGNACPAPQYCATGRCRLDCPTGRTACANRCVDTQTDAQHCGMCGNACRAGFVCNRGMCELTCPMGTAMCTGRCVDLSTDRTNCGACGTTCGAGQLCNGGACAPSCAPTQTNCNGVCVTTASDPSHCGACGVACGPGYACNAGFCRPLVGTDAAGCAPPSLMCGTACIEPRNDNNHCGGCGRPCAADRLCVQGTCVAPCAAGQTRCGTACVNLTSDRMNCSACGMACATGLSCVSSRCVAEATFRVDSLTSAGCMGIEHGTTSGDDRGGIGVSSSQVFYTGDTSTMRASLADLTGAAAVMAQHDGIFTDLATYTSYVLLNAAGTQPTGFSLSAPFTVTQLGELDGATGALTMRRIPLSAPVVINTNTGIFSGRARLVLHTGTPAAGQMAQWVQVRLPSGEVSVLRAAASPTHSSCESWAYWGVAEFFDSQAHVLYVESSTRIARYRVSDGVITTAGTFTNLSDMCTFTVHPMRNRWYWHHEGTSQFVSGDESLGYCNATTSTP